ncbi:MAG: FecR family protein [Pseudobacter sp.]|uniref:FecR family protein n=1 Tax=Pseudobacter sp. TaxID=2045420 RepID=UPI003F810BBD
MQGSPLSELLDKYVTGSLSEAEKKELAGMLDNVSAQEELQALLQASFMDDRYEAADNTELQTSLHEFLQQHMDADALQKRSAPLRRLLRFAAAAAVLLIIGGTAWWWNTKHAPANQTEITIAKGDIDPAKSSVTLTLGNGQQIDLEGSPDGALTTEGGAGIVKNGSLLSYNLQPSSDKIVYNTVSTSYGSQYLLELADGTKVWLNASSSLRYPTAFKGAERVVELQGEGYFEVAKNAAQPFRVRSGTANIQVLGTRFNVNAYAGDPLRTTLLNGSVKINGQILKPGQQAILDNNDQVNLTEAGIEEVMAWKNGLFLFNNRPLPEIMREVERWYQVKVVFAGPVKGRFTSTLRRNIPLSKLLRTLELTDEVTFRIEGNTITVKPVTQ